MSQSLNLQELNAMAYELHAKLLDAIDAYVGEHNNKVPTMVVVGASNLLCASNLVSNSRNREVALDVFEESSKVIRRTIEETPDRFFFNSEISMN